MVLFSLFQNRKNCGNRTLNLDRRVVGVPNNLRNNSRHSNNSSLSNSGRTSPPSSPTSNMISFNDSTPFGRDLTKTKLDRSMSEPSTGDRNSNQQTQGRNGNVNSTRYKTELCRPFEENGHCKYGDKCQFAHGAHELRSLSRHPKYKTELCRTFHTTGFCPYGPRCHFVHNEDETKLNSMIKAKQQQQTQQLQNQLQNQVYQPQQQSNRAVQRPRALSFNVTMPLGSTADSPPSSVTDSPSLSPVFFGEDLCTNTSLPATPFATPANHFFNGQDLPSPTMSPVVNNLARQQVAHFDFVAALNQRNNNESVFIDDVFGAPPSPPESLVGDDQICGSPLDVSRSLRLPIFSKLSISDEHCDFI